MDVDKLESYADKAAEQFEKDKQEFGENKALSNQFKEIKTDKP